MTKVIAVAKITAIKQAPSSIEEFKSRVNMSSLLNKFANSEQEYTEIYLNSLLLVNFAWLKVK